MYEFSVTLKNNTGGYNYLTVFSPNIWAVEKAFPKANILCMHIGFTKEMEKTVGFEIQKFEHRLV